MKYFIFRDTMCRPANSLQVSFAQRPYQCIWGSLRSFQARIRFSVAHFDKNLEWSQHFSYAWIVLPWGKKISVIWTPVCICSQHCLLVFFSDILNTPIGWQAFQNIGKYCWCILKDVLRACIEGMNGMTGICVSLTLHHLLPLRNYRKILRKNLHPKWNVKACKA